MAQRIIHSRMIAPGPPGEGMDPGQVAELEAFKERTSTQRYDIREWGNPFTAEPGTLMATAASEVQAAGGGIITAPAGEYSFRVAPPFVDGVYYEFPGSANTHLDFTLLDTPLSGSAMYGTGSLSALPALNGDIPRHSRSVTFASSHGLVAGDVFVLYNSADSSFSVARTYYRAGEFCRVDSVSGNTVTISAPTYGAYTSGGTTSAYKLNPIRTGLRGATITFPQSIHGMRVDLGSKLRFEDIDASNADVSHLTLSRCYDWNLNDFRAFDNHPQAGGGLNYGVMLLNCQRGRITTPDLETRRHGLTTGGDNSVAGVPNRDIRVLGGRIAGMSDVAGVCGCNLHGNSEDISFDAVAMPAGFNPAGDDIAVRHCDIDSPAWGSAISSMELLGVNLNFEYNRIRANANHNPQRGLVYILLDDYTTRDKGLLRFVGNDVDLGPYGSTGTTVMALHVLVNHEDVSDNNIAEIRLNTFRTEQAVTANHYAVRIRGTGGLTTHGFSDVYAIDNINPHGMRIEQASLGTTRMHFVGAGTGAPAFLAGASSQWRRLDGGGSSTLYLNESGSTVWRAVPTILTATATLDFPSIAAGTTENLTITVTGASIGDVVHLGPPSGLVTGLVATGFVSASNTVTVRLANVTAAAIDPASATWRATVIKS